MPRQFFVGGNFKLNPVSLNEKRALIKVLNDADIDSNTGTELFLRDSKPPRYPLLSEIVKRL